MTMTSMTQAANSDQIRALSQDEINDVAGGRKSAADAGGAAGCFPIFEDDGKGGIIIISPTLGPLGRLF
jgi:hypothetical protein